MKSFVVATVAGHKFAMPLESIISIERKELLIPPPAGMDAPSAILFNQAARPVRIMGESLGLFDVHVSFTSQVLLFRGDHGEFGSIVDRVSSTQRIPDSDVFPCPLGFGPFEQTLYSGVLLLEEQLIPIVNPAVLGNDFSVPPNRPSQQLPVCQDTRKLLLFDLDAASSESNRIVGLGLAAESVKEIIDVQKFVPLPPNESHLAGMMMYRGEPIAVMDLGQRVGLRPGQRELSRVVIVQYQRGFLAVPAGKQVAIKSLNSRHVVSRRAWNLHQDQVAGIVDFDEYSVILPKAYA
jgi:chemotaxis signal transduction protein